MNLVFLLCFAQRSFEGTGQVECHCSLMVVILSPSQNNSQPSPEPWQSLWHPLGNGMISLAGSLSPESRNHPQCLLTPEKYFVLQNILG